MRDDLQRVADALAVRLSWLLGVVLAGFAALFAAVESHNWTVAGIAAGFGVVISLIGVRAAILPSRPVRLEHFQNTPGINTSRRAGLFYVAVGLVWVLLALLTAKHS